MTSPCLLGPSNSIDYTNSVWIEVVNNDGKKTVIGVVYRSPNSAETNNEKLNKCLQELSNRNLVIMGDFNYPNIDWNNLHTTRDGSDFMNLIMDNFLCQHVNFPTRENNILDLFISSDPNMVDNLQCVGKLGSSDHVLVLAELNFKTCVAENLQEIPDWKKANMDRIKDSLNIDLKQKLEGKDTFSSWNGFKSLLNNSINNNVPMKKRRTETNNKIWITREIVRQIRKKKHLYRTID